MIVEKLGIEEVLLITPDVYKDERGLFFESFNAEKFKTHTGLDISFVQDNESFSTKGVLRGLHYQISPKSQSKLVRVTQGEVFDVAVDVRKDSPTFSKWVGVKLDAVKKQQLFIPKGFAHGFLVLSNTAVVSYKCDEFYSKEHERAVRYNDVNLDIKWPEITDIDYILSEKDIQASFIERL